MDDLMHRNLWWYTAPSFCPSQKWGHIRNEQMERESINQSFEPQILKGIYYTGPMYSIIAHYSKSAILALGSSNQIYLVTFICLTDDTSFNLKRKSNISRCFFDISNAKN